MFFLVHEHLPKARLHECGTTLSSLETLFHETPGDFIDKQKNLYHFAFGIPKEKHTLQGVIRKTLNALAI